MTAGVVCMALALLPAWPIAAALARAMSCSPCFVPAAVALHAFLPATIRVTVVSELTKLIYEGVFAIRHER